MVQPNDPDRQRVWRTSLAIAAAVLLGVVSFAVPGLGPSRPVPEPATSDDARAAESRSAKDAFSRRSDGRRSHAEGDAEEAGTDGSDLPHATIEGRLIDQPVDSIAFELEVDSPSSSAIPPTLELVSSSSDGEFALRLGRPQPAATYTLRLSAAQIATHGLRLRNLSQGSAIHLGDIPLTSSLGLRVEVVDEQGRPMPQLEIQIEEPVESLGLRDVIARPERLEARQHTHTTDPSGRADFGALHPAARIVAVQDPLRSQVYAILEDHRSSDASRRLTVRAQLPELSGTVQAEAVPALDEATLLFLDVRSGEVAFSTSPNAQGRFAVSRPETVTEGLFRPALLHPDGSRLLCDLPSVPVPAAGLRLEFTQHAGFEVIVTTPEGQRTDSFTLIWFGVDGTVLRAANRTFLGEGHVRIDAPPERMDSPHLMAHSSGDFAASAAMPIHGRVIELGLSDWREQRFRVVDGEDKPIAGCLLAVFESGGNIPLGRQAKSDAEGFAVLQVPAGTPYSIQAMDREEGFVFGQGHPVQPLEVLDLDQTCSVEVSCTGFDASVWPDGARLGVHSECKGERSHITWFKTGADSLSLSLPHDRPATLRALVALDGQLDDRRAIPLPGSAIEIRATPGSHHRLDVSSAPPGSLSIEVPAREADSIYKRGPVGLWLIDEPRMSARLIRPTRVDAQDQGTERWVFDCLPAGRYRAHGHEPLVSQVLEVRAGTASSAEISASTRRIELLLTDSTGSPIADRRVEILSSDTIAHRAALTSDANGIVVLEPAPDTMLTVQTGEPPHQLSGTATVDPSQTSDRIRVVLK